MLSPQRGIIFAAPILIHTLGPWHITHAYVWDFLYVHPKDPPTYLCLTSFPPFRSLFLCQAQMWQHVSHIREDCYRPKKSEGWKKAELSQWSQHLPVLNWCKGRAGGRRVYHMSHLKAVSVHSHGVKQKRSFFSVFFTLLGHIFPEMES